MFVIKCQLTVFQKPTQFHFETDEQLLLLEVETCGANFCLLGELMCSLNYQLPLGYKD